MSAPPPTAVLIQAVARSADKAAFAQLFEEFAPRVKRFLLRRTRGNENLSEELMQETMLKVWKKSAHFDHTRGGASTWIFTIARNALIDHSRRKRPEVDESDPALVADTSPRADQAASEAERAVRVREALAGLPEQQSVILHAAYFEGRTLREISEQQGVPLGTVKSRVRLAMGRLRGALGGLAS